MYLIYQAIESLMYKRIANEGLWGAPYRRTSWETTVSNQVDNPNRESLNQASLMWPLCKDAWLVYVEHLFLRQTAGHKAKPRLLTLASSPQTDSSPLLS